MKSRTMAQLLSLPALTIASIHANCEHFHEAYDMQLPIGRGTFGQVRKCFHHATGKSKAVKIVDTSHGTLERKVMHKIQQYGGHQHILKYFESFQDESKLYLITEYIQGQTLYDHIVLHTKLPEQNALKLFDQLLQAVDFLHHRKILHGDIKPDNIMVSNDGLKIIDFGSAQHISNGSSSSISGTKCYWPPEMLQGSLPSPSMDVWAMGCILFILLTGTHPFDPSGKASYSRIISNIQNKSPTYPNTISKPIQELLSQMLAKDPNHRPSTLELRNQLQLTLDL